MGVGVAVLLICTVLYLVHRHRANKQKDVLMAQEIGDWIKKDGGKIEINFRPDGENDADGFEMSTFPDTTHVSLRLMSDSLEQLRGKQQRGTNQRMI